MGESGSGVEAGLASREEEEEGRENDERGGVDSDRKFGREDVRRAGRNGGGDRRGGDVANRGIVERDRECDLERKSKEREIRDGGGNGGGEEILERGGGSTAILRQQRRRRPVAATAAAACGGGGGLGTVESRGYHVIGARSGSGLGGGRGGGMKACSGRDGGWSPSLIFLEQPLEREFTPFFLQMTARVCGGSILLL